MYPTPHDPQAESSDKAALNWGGGAVQCFLGQATWRGMGIGEPVGSVATALHSAFKAWSSPFKVEVQSTLCRARVL